MRIGLSSILPAVLISLFFIGSAYCEYNPDALKQGLTEQKESFKIKKWRRAKKGEASIAKTKLKNVELSVGDKSSKIMVTIKNSEQSMQALTYCINFATTGISPTDENQRYKLESTIFSAIENQTLKSLVMNGVKLEATRTITDGKDCLSCTLSPAE